MRGTKALLLAATVFAVACGKVSGSVQSTGVDAGSGGQASSGDAARVADRGPIDGSAGHVDGGLVETPDGGVAPDAPPPGVPPALFEQPTVWIGKVERTVTYPRDTSSDVVQRVVLVLDAITTRVTGSVTFGSGDPPEPLIQATDMCPEIETWDEEQCQARAANWRYNPYDGFEYSILRSELRGSRLALSFAPVELWRDWCPLQTPPFEGEEYCDCSDDSCTALGAPTRRLDLVLEGDRMEGELSRPAGPGLGEPPAIRLQRVE